MTSSISFAEVIGEPIAHSKSPSIHQFWLQKLGLDFRYAATLVGRGELPEFLAGRRGEDGWRGCNVTMPLKLDALLLADRRSDLAVAAGAANILLPREGKLLAGNTDIGAVLRLLAPYLEKAGAPDGVTLLGNGGAARAVLVAMRMLGLADVRIQARDLTAGTKLAVEFGLQEGPRPFTLPVDSSVLINATPLGMAGFPPVDIDLAGMPKDGLVIDMVTEPAETRLLAAARSRGLGAVDGLSLLVEQAADSFMLLFGHEAPRQHDAELMAILRP